ncbi:MAG: hypothetical protein ACKVIR_05810 [Candidatus Poseidoniales archaeon]
MRTCAWILILLFAGLPLLGLISPPNETADANYEGFLDSSGLGIAQHDALTELDLGISSSQVSGRAAGTQFDNSAGGNSEDRGQAIVVDSNGNAYVTGFFKQIATFGSTSVTSYGGKDIFVAKLTPTGTWDWVTKAGSTSDDESKDIEIDSNGDLTITGYCSGNSTFGSIDVTCDATYQDIIVAKINQTGSWQWAIASNQTSGYYASGEGLAIDSNDDIFITGHTDAGKIGNTSVFNSIFVSKVLSNGTWGDSVYFSASNGYSSNKGLALDLNSNGEIFVTGQFLSTITIDGNSITSSGHTDIFVAKFHANLTNIWLVKAGGSETSYGDSGAAIAVDSNGDAYLTGSIDEEAAFGSTTLYASSKDIFFAKILANGTWDWATTNSSSSGTSWGTDVLINTNGEIIFSGKYSNIDWWTTTKSGYGFVASLNSSGTYQWAGGMYDAEVNGISIDNNGLIYASGTEDENGHYDIAVRVFDGANPDSDTYPSGFDNCPTIMNENQSDYENDGDGDICDSDDDNDGIIDTNDDCPINGIYNWTSNSASDYDSDGCRDYYDEETDADNDGKSNDNDDCPRGNLNWTSNSTTDHDSDGCRDSTEDSDDDNDGVSDSNDLCPTGLIPSGYSSWNSDGDNYDRDNDGCSNSEDDDDDGDLVLDAADSCNGWGEDPSDSGWVSNNSTDHDSDGCQDDGEDDDDDNDGISDNSDWGGNGDSCRRGNLNWTSNSTNDYDSDGCEDASEDNDDDNDNVNDTDDNCPVGAKPQPEMGQWDPWDDLDGDGCTNSEDIDDDGDSVLDDDDDCDNWGGNIMVNWNSTSLTDHDSDGCNDQNEDDDDDNDGVEDYNDNCTKGDLNWTSTQTGAYSAFPADWDLENSTDWDSDGCQDDGEDNDDDDDGVNDDDDDCAKGLTNWRQYDANFWWNATYYSGYNPDSDGDGCHDYLGSDNNSTRFGSYLGEDINDDNDEYLDINDSCSTLAGTSNLTITENISFFGRDSQGDSRSVSLSSNQIGCPDSDGDQWPSIVLIKPEFGYYYLLPFDMFENDSTQWWDSDGDGLGDNYISEDDRLSHWPGWLVINANNSDINPLDRDNDGFEDLHLSLSLLLGANYDVDGDERLINEEPEVRWDSCIDDYGTSVWGWEASNTYNWKFYHGGCQDSDGDLFVDDSDWDENDGTQWADTDSDGFGDNYIGFEGDGCPNTWGDSWRDRHGCVDGDRDGTSDFGDIFEKNATQWQDLDGDGFGDNWGDSSINDSRPDNWPGQWIDSAFKPDPSPFDYDNDGFEDSQFGGNGPFDACPLVYGTSTIDQVGCPDADGDGYSDMGDMVPNDPTQWIDTDGDGFGDNVNGTMADSCPNQPGTSFRDAYGCTDSDGDGWSILMDFDDNSTNVWSDLDGDGYPDQPGFSNSDDCVNQAGNSTTPWKGCADIDGDGTMDIADLDADGDGITNALELQAGGAMSMAFDIYNSSSVPPDLDGDGMPDVLDSDTDGDDFPDDLERERGTNPNDAEDTPISQYGENTGIYYVPGDGFQSSYDPQGYELSVSALVFMLTSEFLLPLILLPASFFLVMRKGKRFKKVRKQLRNTTNIAQLEGAEQMIDNLILKNKVKVVHGVLLRNQFERCRDKLKEKAAAPVKRVRPPPASSNY